MCLVYHGTNAVRDRLKAGSWVTTDIEMAWHFANQKQASSGGRPVVMALTIEEIAVEWDVFSALAGVDDERGRLLADHDAVALAESSAPR